MKKNLFYLYGGIWMVFLVFIGSVADNMLFALIKFFDLSGVNELRVYLLATSLLMLILSLFMIASTRSKKVDGAIMLRILFASVIGGIGSAWLLIVFLRREL